MLNHLLSGFYYFIKGFTLLIKPDIRRWVLIPLLINIFSFSILMYYGWLYHQIIIEMVVSGVQNGLPNWEWLTPMVRWLMWIPFIVIALLVIIMTLIAQLIGGSFNRKLAQAVEKHLTGQSIESPAKSWWRALMRIIWYPIEKLLYYLRWILVLLILSLIPVINTISPLLWFLFGAWLISLEYADIVLSYHGYHSPQQRQLLAKKRVLMLSFGSTVSVAMLIPVINFFVIPVGIAGMTYLWVREFADSSRVCSSSAIEGNKNTLPILPG